MDPIRDREHTGPPTSWLVCDQAGRPIGVVAKRTPIGPAQWTYGATVHVPVESAPFVALASDGRELGYYGSRANAGDAVAIDWKDMQVAGYAQRRAQDRRREQRALAMIPPLTLPRATT